ncbi:hypothetical protein AAFC00_006024 [Neodothiora populina]|uniref:DUF676 domain-containing protein n=1 Tax=Neodothiora populina TaxID=2781224 RepID=A0ABR3P6T9_9PEZI
MLLVHQAGSVKVGEVIRYTLTYTPSQDRILPSPKHLHLKIKNTSAIPLRAAYLHGPYTLHVSQYPATFNPNKKVEDPKKHGVPDFEPLLKAGGHWTSELTVPEDIRETGATFAHGRKSQDARRSQDQKGKSKEDGKSVTWIIEIASQILFSNSAAVHFEVLVGRDERSLDLGFAAVAGHGHGAPGQVGDHKERSSKSHGQTSHPQKGVYSKAVKLVCEDTEALWDKPSLPTKEDIHDGQRRGDRRSEDTTKQSADSATSDTEKPIKKKKIHLVVLTHGLHSNIGADMLYLKESIDATVKQARLDARKRKAAYKAQQREKQQKQSGSQTTEAGSSDNPDSSTAPLTGGQEELQDNDDDGSDDEEQTIVRGFTGNAVRTERGIQYLGKRLAKYILHFTYPDQPFLPVKKSMTRSFADSFKSSSIKEARDGLPSHNGSSIHKGQEQGARKEDLAYTFTSISFVGHSLGGLIQTYAVAYIQKHAPHFFTQVQPINFICMASPLLGLSNENPMYVKFALDFGLVGRTGQDLGLTWRAPTLAKSGWSNLVNGFGNQSKEKEKEKDPGAKPLLRILPTGPAHTVLRMFRNRTVYANVVNDGIVPLRTSCLLFLDWRGLGKVDKARRENGLIGTMAEWGWAELTGANALSKTARYGEMNSADDEGDESGSGANTPTQKGQGETVPQPAENTTTDDNKSLVRSASASTEPEEGQFVKNQVHSTSRGNSIGSNASETKNESGGGLLDSFMSFIRPSKTQSNKVTKAIRRGQTMSPSPSESGLSESQGRRKSDEKERRSLISRGSTDNPTMLHPHSANRPGGSGGSGKKRPGVSRGFSTEIDSLAPPRTSIFESASDILHPPIPSTAWIIDPASRSRTIFHDRVYHPEDIPPPPVRRPGLGRSLSGLTSRSFSSDSVTLKSLASKDQAATANNNPSTSTPSLAHTADENPSIDFSSMKVEEKIARAYHRDLSWRKVLVRLEPDAHNNMIVRRMFANAYGWPVVKHLCDTHFADTWTARARDEDEAAWDRAQGLKAGEHVGAEGEEVKGQSDKSAPKRSGDEMREERDELGALKEVGTGVERHRTLNSAAREATTGGLNSASGVWDDVYFEGGSDEDDDDDDDDSYAGKLHKVMGNWGIGGGGGGSPPSPASAAPSPSSNDKQKRKTSRTNPNRLSHLRSASSGSSSSSSSSNSPPMLSPDTATGSFIAGSPSLSPNGSTSTLTPLKQRQKEQQQKDRAADTNPPQPPQKIISSTLVAEPEPLSSGPETEAPDPGNTTPVLSPSAAPSSSTPATAPGADPAAVKADRETEEARTQRRHGSVDTSVGLDLSRKSMLEDGAVASPAVVGSASGPGTARSGVVGQGASGGEAGEAGEEQKAEEEEEEGTKSGMGDMEVVARLASGGA